MAEEYQEQSFYLTEEQWAVFDRMEKFLQYSVAKGHLSQVEADSRREEYLEYANNNADYDPRAFSLYPDIQSFAKAQSRADDKAIEDAARGAAQKIKAGHEAFVKEAVPFREGMEKQMALKAQGRGLSMAGGLMEREELATQPSAIPSMPEIDEAFEKFAAKQLTPAQLEYFRPRLGQIYGGEFEDQDLRGRWWNTLQGNEKAIQERTSAEKLDAWIKQEERLRKIGSSWLGRSHDYTNPWTLEAQAGKTALSHAAELREKIEGLTPVVEEQRRAKEFFAGQESGDGLRYSTAFEKHMREVRGGLRRETSGEDPGAESIKEDPWAKFVEDYDFKQEYYETPRELRRPYSQQYRFNPRARWNV